MAAAAAAADQVDWAPLEGAMSALENAVGPAMDQDIGDGGAALAELPSLGHRVLCELPVRFTFTRKE